MNEKSTRSQLTGPDNQRVPVKKDTRPHIKIKDMRGFTGRVTNREPDLTKPLDQVGIWNERGGYCGGSYC